jgi:S1-C subfamily serine protease
MKRFLWLGLILLISIFAFTSCTLPNFMVRSDTSTSPTPSSASVQAPAVSLTGTSATANAATPPVSSSNIQIPLPTSIAGLESLLESIYNQVNPSVVNIQVVEKSQQTPFPSIPGFQINPGTPQFSSVLGSGFIWDTAGDIVTNNHVIAGADTITVTFHDGTTVPAALVGADPDSDMAVIKVNDLSLPLQPLTLADSTQLKVGQLAIAIGNPFGYQGTMTVGFVSGLGRVLPTNENALGPTYSIPDIIQTDASINPGNSGGVLLDDAGKVIGVTQSIVSNSGTSSGVGFAIPSAIVQQVVPSLIKNGSYDHPYLGVSVTSMGPDLAKAMSLPANQRGALIQGISVGGPAEKAGLKASQNEVTINGQTIAVGGDIIIAYNDQPIKSSDDLITILARSGLIGETVTLTVLRGSQQVQVPVILEKRPSSS